MLGALPSTLVRGSIKEEAHYSGDIASYWVLGQRRKPTLQYTENLLRGSQEVSSHEEVHDNAAEEAKTLKSYRAQPVRLSG